jgi:hypothetical protein
VSLLTTASASAASLLPQLDESDQHGLEATLTGLRDCTKIYGHLDHGRHIPKDTLVEIHVSTFTLLNGCIHKDE